MPNYNRMRTSLLCTFTVLLCTCVRAQKADSIWSEADRLRYAREHADPGSWDMDLLKEDLVNSHDTAFVRRLSPALHNMPAPVPPYDWGFVNMRITELSIAKKTILGATYTYAFDQYRPRAMADSLAYYRNYFNIFVLTDTVGDGTRALMINSRNAPHYLGTGKQLTSVGPVEFAQMSLASGENFAIICQRYFDLQFGRTVLVAPFKDGSVRFLQLDDSPESLRAGTGSDEYNGEVIKAFQKRLSRDERVTSFFTQAGTLD